MKIKKLILLVIIVMAAPAITQAQHKISGVIKNDSGEKLENVHLSIVELNRGAVSDFNGYFEFNNIKNGVYTIKTSMVGYQPKEEKVTVNKSTIHLIIALDVAIEKLKGVQVISGTSKNERVNFETSKLKVKYKHQPQTVSVITAADIKERQYTTLNEVVDQAPGVYSFATWGGWGNGFGARGMRGVTVLKNGVPVANSKEHSPDVASMENVQLIRGSGSILNGNIRPGGTINLVTKKPRFSNGGYANLTVGSFNRARSEFDVYGPLDSNNKVAFRINGSGEKSKSFRNVIENDNLYINPSITYQFDDVTAITMEYLSSSRSYNTDIGNILYKGEVSDDIQKYTGLAEDKNKLTSNNLTLTLSKGVSDHLSLRFTTSFTNTDARLRRLSGFSDTRFTESGDALWFQRNYRENTEGNKRNYFQLDLLGKDLKTGGIGHNFQIGVDHWKNSQSYYRSKTVLIDSVNVKDSFIPNHLSDLTQEQQDLYNNLPRDVEGEREQTKSGFTVQDQMQLNRLRVTVGARLSYVKSKSSSYNFTNDKKFIGPDEDGFGISPLAALSYDINKKITAFATFTNTFNDRYAGESDVNGKDLGNSYINQVEVGIKSMLLNNKLVFNLTGYRIYEQNGVDRAVDQNGDIIPDGQPGGGLVRTGKFENMGLELDLSGHLTEGIKFSLGTSYINARYKESTRYIENSRPFNTPEYSGNLWLYYAPSTGPLKGLFAGVGVNYMGERFGNAYVKINWHGIEAFAEPPMLDAFAQVDMSLGYTFTKNIVVKAKINNLTDVNSFYNYRNIYINPIRPFNFNATFEYKF